MNNKWGIVCYIMLKYMFQTLLKVLNFGDGC